MQFREDPAKFAVSILAGGDVVVVALLGGADHLAARLTLQSDDRRQIPENRRVLSLGMTGDYETAVEEGSTLVRIGTGIFGVRS